MVVGVSLERSVLSKVGPGVILSGRARLDQPNSIHGMFIEDLVYPFGYAKHGFLSLLSASSSTW